MLGLIPAHAGKTFTPSLAFASARAHPRSRGENTRAGCASATSWGSSPLTRGKLRSAAVLVLICGLIPAHAGKTAGQATGRERAWAHPRSRGENEPSRAIRSTAPGSSPLTRGKRQVRPEGQPGAGLIPAHAGKTTWGRCCTSPPRAHPRSRGENRREVRPPPRRPGSSPLTRGKQERGRALDGLRRLIPAHAGKTTRSWITVADEGAHPRSRGENHTAGTHRFERGLAHPRSRGENEAARQPHGWETGSSPLTRGKPGHHWLLRRELGLIPAHAGKTSRRRCRRSPGGAHPRSRGENNTGSCFMRRSQGSSPLTRGKQ